MPLLQGDTFLLLKKFAIRLVITFTLGVGTVDVLKDATEVSGKNTQFTENDIDQECAFKK